MHTIFIAVLILAGLGALAALALALADKYLTVSEDPRIGLLTGALPGANCGGCGFAGCSDYAHALVNGTAALGACVAADEACAAHLAQILGTTAQATQKRVACVMCCGSRTEAVRVGDYNGLCDCTVAAQTAGGDKGCAYGCLGYGACAHVCPKQAISVQNGLAHVDKRLCIGCGKCVAVCPRQIIALVPASVTLHVLCSNPVRGPEVRQVCRVGCLGCHLCERLSGGKEANHFLFKGFLAQVNVENPPTDAQLVTKCPAKCLREDPHFEAGL